MIRILLSVGAATGLLLFSSVITSSRTQDVDTKIDSVDQRKTPSVPKDTLPENIELDNVPKGFSKGPEFPPDNELTEKKARLGRRLFFETRLSKDNSLSCASCHRPEHGFASPQAIAVGVENRLGQRNAPSLLNRAFGKVFFWDGRAGSLEEQSLMPLSNPNEFDSSVEAAIATLSSDESYVKQFSEAFETSDDPASAVTAENFARAIASFERTLVYGDSKVDRFRASEYVSLSREARQGMWIFESSGGCWKCHDGENLSNEQFHNTGVGFGEEKRDVGRFEHTNEAQDRFKFKTPSLRGVALTAPYMHDGSKKTLREVVEFYNKGGSPDDPTLDKKLKPLNLSDAEVGFLVEFLKALSQ